MYKMRRKGIFGSALAAAATLAFCVSPVYAHKYCALCVDYCKTPTNGGCAVYYANSNVRKITRCSAHHNQTCTLTPDTGCYLTYKICTSGTCNGATCQGESGCTTYTYMDVDASATYSGSTTCI